MRRRGTPVRRAVGLLALAALLGSALIAGCGDDDAVAQGGDTGEAVAAGVLSGVSVQMHHEPG